MEATVTSYVKMNLKSSAPPTLIEDPFKQRLVEFKVAMIWLYLQVSISQLFKYDCAKVCMQSCMIFIFDCPLIKICVEKLVACICVALVIMF